MNDLLRRKARSSGRITIAVAMTSGFIALSYEILWYRAFAFVSRGLPTVFGLLLAFYLLGIAIGADVSRKYCKDSSEGSNERRLRVIAAFMGVASAASFCVIPLLAQLATLQLHLPSLPLVPAWTLAFVAVAVAAAMMGAVLPLVAHFGIDADDRAGQKLGYVYLANIIGSTLGSLLTGFVLMEMASTRTISFGLASAGFSMSFLLLLASEPTNGTLAFGWISALACVAASGLCSKPLFNQLYEKLLFKDKFTRDTHLVHVLENRHGVITVDKDTLIYGGGAYDGAFNVSLLDDKNRVERALAVAVLHPHPKEMLMIGLSSGSWAQELVNLQGLDHLTIVEIDPGYLELIPQYPEVASLLKNPKVTIVIDDGRRWLLRHPDRKFDVIVMNTTWHWRAHVTNLLSREFMQIAREHLLPGGLHYFNTTSSANVQRTACLVFPYAVRFENFMAVSDSPITFDRDIYKEVLRNAQVDGKPQLDLTRESDQKVMDGLLSVIDASPKQWASMESRDAILARTQGAREVTDDNMACEWEPNDD
ncbi:MAG: fused MFS/spermidine synthase [Polyangiaceae bacterium]